nr:type II toxin-antitoxin system antitoxin, RelB/DinJ family [Alloscardovia omnicolens]
MFLKTTIRENGIPFNLKLDLSNDVTAAIQEGRSIAIDESVPSYESI